MAEDYGIRKTYGGGVSNVYYQSTTASNVKADLSGAKQLDDLAKAIGTVAKTVGTVEKYRYNTNTQEAADRIKMYQSEGKTAKEIESIVKSGKDPVLARKYASVQVDYDLGVMYGIQDSKARRDMLGANFAEKALDIDMGRNLDDKSSSFNRGYHSQYHADTLRLMEEKAKQVNNIIIKKDTQAIVTKYDASGISPSDAVIQIGNEIRNNPIIPNELSGDVQLNYLTQLFDRAKTSGNLKEQLTLVSNIEKALESKRGMAEELPSLLKDINTSDKAGSLATQLVTLKKSLSTVDEVLTFYKTANSSSDSRIRLNGVDSGSKKDINAQLALEKEYYSFYESKIFEENPEFSNEQVEQLATMEAFKAMQKHTAGLGRPYLRLEEMFVTPHNRFKHQGGSFVDNQDNIDYIENMLNLYNTYQANNIDIANQLKPDQTAFYEVLNANVTIFGETVKQSLAMMVQAQQATEQSPLSSAAMEELLKTITIDGKRGIFKYVGRETLNKEMRKYPVLEQNIKTILQEYHKLGGLSPDGKTMKNLADTIDKRFWIDEAGSVMSTIRFNSDEVKEKWNANTKVFYEAVLKRLNEGVDDDAKLEMKDIALINKTGYGDSYILVNRMAGTPIISKNEMELFGKDIMAQSTFEFNLGDFLADTDELKLQIASEEAARKAKRKQDLAKGMGNRRLQYMLNTTESSKEENAQVDNTNPRTKVLKGKKQNKENEPQVTEENLQQQLDLLEGEATKEILGQRFERFSGAKIR